MATNLLSSSVDVDILRNDGRVIAAPIYCQFEESGIKKWCQRSQFESDPL